MTIVKLSETELLNCDQCGSFKGNGWDVGNGANMVLLCGNCIRAALEELDRLDHGAEMLDIRIDPTLLDVLNIRIEGCTVIGNTFSGDKGTPGIHIIEEAQPKA